MILKKPASFTPNIQQLRLGVLGLFLALDAIPAIAQVPTGAVQGHVICSDGDVPARGANVGLVPLASLLAQRGGAKPDSEQVPESKTDFNGNYVLPSVPVGSYIVHASMAGYSSDFPLVSAVLSRFTLDDRKKLLAEFPQVIVEAGTIATKNIVIRRGGAIMGRVSVDTGGTLGPTRVIATMVSSDLLGSVDGDSGGKPLDLELSGLTDDRGMYRIAGLPAGKYRIYVKLNEEYYQAFDFGGGRLTAKPTRIGTGSVTVYAPDALTSNDANLVKVGEGDELSDLDITIPMSRLHSIGGVVTQGGAVLVGADLIILRDGKRAADSDATSTSDGSYRFDLLPAETYTIQAKYRDPALSLGPSVTQKLTVQLMDNDILDANIDLPTTATAK